MQNLDKLDNFLTSLKSQEPHLSNTQYYQSMELLAQLKRREYGIENTKMGLRLMRSIYSQEGIRIDIAPRRLKKVRAAYFCDGGDYSVILSPNLPNEPKLFSLAHELKHHFVDQDRITVACVDVTDKSPRIEIGAEVFAAEFIHPVEIFKQCIQELDIEPGDCKPEDICKLKTEFDIPLSYQAICKRVYHLRIMPKGCFDKVKFTKVSEMVYGEPMYKAIQRNKRDRGR